MLEFARTATTMVLEAVHVVRENLLKKIDDVKFSVAAASMNNNDKEDAV